MERMDKEMTNKEIAERVTSVVAKYHFTSRMGVKGDVQIIDKKGRLAGSIDTNTLQITAMYSGRQVLLGSLIRNDINFSLAK